MEPYYTIRIPFVPLALSTVWHPREDFGPFKVLCRGNFKTIEEAIAWGQARLNGCPYSIALVDSDGEMHKD